VRPTPPLHAIEPTIRPRPCTPRTAPSLARRAA
jgi:hypothetical protein